MEPLFELRILSPLGPTISKLQVDVEGETAWCTDFEEKDRDFDFDSTEELLAKVAEEYEECFRYLSDSIIEVDAEPEIEEQVREYLWEYRHEDEGTEIEEKETWRRRSPEVIQVFEDETEDTDSDDEDDDED